MTVRRILMSCLLGAVAAGMLYSCKNAAEKEGTDEADALKLKIENCQDPDSVKIYAAEARDYAERLEAQGKGEEAAAFLETLIPVVQSRDSEAVSVFDQLKSKALKEVANAKKHSEMADSVAKAGKQSADSIAKAAKDGLKDAAKSAADKAGDAYDKGKKAVNDAARSAADKAGEAYNKGKEAADNAKDAYHKGKETLKNLGK